MCDIHDVVNASHEAADVIVSTVYDYGEGSLGNGIRKCVEEAHNIGNQQGYIEGFIDSYPLGRFQGYSEGCTDGIIKGTLLGAGITLVLGIATYGIDKFKKYKEKKSKHVDDEEVYNDEP